MPLVLYNSGILTAPLPTFDQMMAALGAQVSSDYLFGTGVSPGPGQVGITNLTQLQQYFNAWGDSMVPPSWGDTPNGINGENFNSDMERFQAFNATNHVFNTNSLSLTAVNEHLSTFQTSITTGTSGTQYTLPTAVPIATLGFVSTQSFSGTGGTGGVSSNQLVIASVAQGALYQGNQLTGTGIPAGTHVVAAPAGNVAGIYTLNQAVTVTSGTTITCANAPVIGQILVSMFRGIYQITAITANTSLTLTPILNSNGTNIAFNNATVLLPYYYTTLSASLTTGATGASLNSIPTGVVNGMMFAIVNGSAVVSNSTNRITISGSTVTFDNPWTYDEPTFPIGQGVIFMQPITSGQMWSNTYYLPTATNWVAFDEYVTFPTDSNGGQNLLSNTAALTITNAAQIAAVVQNFAWGAFPSCWMYGGNFPTAGHFDNSEVDFITIRYYPPQGPWTNVMGFFDAGQTATVAQLNPPAVASTTTAGQGANVFLSSVATPQDLILYSGVSLAGPTRVSVLWTGTQASVYINNILVAEINYTWTGAGWAQLGFQNCVGTFNSTGKDLSFPLLAANFASYVTSVSRLKVLRPAPPLQITTASLPAATVGTAYSQTLNATGGVAPYTWSMVSDSPDTGSWLSLSTGGVLSGTPGTAENESLVVQVMDSQNTYIQAAFTLVVNASGGTSLTNNVAFTVTGSGFGTKSGSTPTIYDNCQGTQLLQANGGLWSTSWHSSQSSPTDPWREQYHLPTDLTPNGDTWGATTGAIVNPATPFRSKYICSALESTAGGYDSRNIMFGLSTATGVGSAPPYYLVASWYETTSPNWQFGINTVGANDNNFKWIVYTTELTGGFGSVYWYLEYKDSTVTSYTCLPPVNINDDGAGITGRTNSSPAYGWNAPPMTSDLYNPFQQWVKREISIYFSNVSGGSGYISLTNSLAGKAARQNQYLWNSATHGGTTAITDAYSGTGRSFQIGGFMRSSPAATNRRYYSDIYLDIQASGVGRFALTDTNSLTTTTCIEYQPYTSWSNTSVTLTCQKGNLASGTVYLWYLDEVNGNRLIGPYTMN